MSGNSQFRRLLSTATVHAMNSGNFSIDHSHCAPWLFDECVCDGQTILICLTPDKSPLQVMPIHEFNFNDSQLKKVMPSRQNYLILFNGQQFFMASEEFFASNLQNIFIIYTYRSLGSTKFKKIDVYLKWHW